VDLCDLILMQPDKNVVLVLSPRHDNAIQSVEHMAGDALADQF
jgi:hypothetical protein